MKKFTIKLILSVLIFTTVLSNTSLAFAENSSEEDLEISNEISQEFADTKYIDGSINHEFTELESDDDTISYQVDVKEEFGIENDSFVQKWVKEALQKNPSIKFNEKYDKLSFTITANVGKKVGTKGETKIKVVFDYTGKIWTAYPAK